jgi:hypothetical protein
MRATEVLRARAVEVATTLVVTVVVLGPLYVGRGIALRGDMVFTPDQPWKPAWLGLDGSVPRAVPMDALIAVVDGVVPGALLQRLLLTAAFLAGGLGIARLARGLHPAAGAGAVIVYLWNPWVHERLAIGQWATVLGYGLLPWLVLASARAREGRPRGWPAAALLLVLMAVCAPSVGLVGVLVGTAVVATRARVRGILAMLGLAAVANLPWILPGLLGPGIRASSAQFGDFAARGESPLGTLASLASMGGIWKTSIVPPEREHVIVVAVAGLLAVAFLASLRYSSASGVDRRTTLGLVAAGAASFMLAALPTIGAVSRALGSFATDVPALGLLRDSHRYLAPFGLLLALGAALLVDRLFTAGPRDQAARTATAVVLLVAPVVLLPSMAWGLAGAVRPVSFPADWSRVAAEVATARGATVVLPWTGSYRGYAWNDFRAVLDPTPRFLPGDVLIDDRHFLRDAVVPGEDPFLAKIGSALRSDDSARRLRDLGVRWVLVERGNGVALTDVPAGTSAFDGKWLRLVDLGAPTRDLRHLRPAPAWPIVIAGDVAAGLVVCVSVWLLSGIRRRTGR